MSRDENLRMKFTNLTTYGTIPFLFFDYIHIMHHWKYKRQNEQLEQDESDLIKISHNQKPSREKYLNGPSSAPGDSPLLNRCFYAYPRQSQCERCLALHSISLGIRAYSFISSQGGFHCVLSFTRLYTYIKIQENSAKNYCRSINSLSVIACYNLNRIFPGTKKHCNMVAIQPDHIQGLISSEVDIFFGIYYHGVILEVIRLSALIMTPDMARHTKKSITSKKISDSRRQLAYAFDQLKAAVLPFCDVWFQGLVIATWSFSWDVQLWQSKSFLSTPLSLKRPFHMKAKTYILAHVSLQQKNPLDFYLTEYDIVHKFL